ncbi:hypothetical protein [Rhizobium leguminosarum]|uniref:hypothetical protein n=1 Tax=Rhizobium leguminosarum TaxID=384 RepID=UPI0010327B95|nr:hypothetical protein [Rhizobium leguminosarum]TBG52639.1 hypothetical protein ELG74_36720 [Rhizobium leguminosarum]
MEAILTSTALTALAADVKGKLAAIVAELTEIEMHTAAVYKETHAAYCDAKGGNYEVLGAEDELAYGINNAAYSARYKLENQIESLVNSIDRHAERYAQMEIKRKINANIETAKTTEAIDCGVNILSANIQLYKGKPGNVAHVLYMLGGEVFEATVNADEKTGALSIWKGWGGDYEGAQPRAEGKQNHFQFFFWAEMTPEEIGKAVDLKAKIIRAARTQFDALPRKRR